MSPSDRSCNLSFYSSDLLLDPLQLGLRVLQLVSAVQHLLALLLSGGQMTNRRVG